MLVNLHVKNFALIDEIDVDFGRHLNILTGETGAGKSILVGSINIALGARVSPEMIGRNGDHATVEAVFQIENENTLEKLRELDVYPEDGQLVISRKITENRSVNKINGESVAVSVIRKAAALCLDIHGQHEHQSLLSRERHLEIVDEYGGEPVEKLKRKIAELYREYRSVQQEMEQDDLPADERSRRIGFLQYERDEIDAAHLTQEEMDSIEDDFRLASHAGTIVETLGEVHEYCGDAVSGAVGRSLKKLGDIEDFDPAIAGFSEELLQIENLLNDFNREISSFMDDFSFDEGELNQMQSRLDQIHALQAKYGDTCEEIMTYRQRAEEELARLSDYENYCLERQKRFEELQGELETQCGALTKSRKKTAKRLEKEIVAALSDLNFAHVDFEIQIAPKEHFSAQGKDEVEFKIATNPGEPKRSLEKIASGGELSRIMLAIKSVFADSDEIETLIFDEIDVGISGRTAQKVSEKMNVLGKSHQILCITHLAQIAAMADRHYAIEKAVEKDRSTTRIRLLSPEEAEEELARILGGVEITEAVRESAREMKRLAREQKNYA